MPELLIFGDHRVLIDESDYALVSQYRWHLDSGGYAIRQTGKDAQGKRHTVLLHRMLWEAHHGPLPFFSHMLDLDHKNGNKLDNRLDNLQLLTRKQHKMKHRLANPERFMSRLAGVQWRASRQKWQAKICINGKRKTLGSFLSEQEASNAYQAALAQLGV